MTILKNGSKGKDVTVLQNNLNIKGAYPKIPTNGIFDSATESAVKAFQKRVGLNADGIVGSDTNTFLTFVRGRVIAIADQVLSSDGLYFIYKHEAWAGHSNHLHFPGGSSGVTLGPGYDFKERNALDVQKTLESVGVDSVSAAKASKGAGLSGSSANTFATNNINLINLTAKQETDLLGVVVRPYIARIKSGIKVNITQYEFDALVEFAYNPGGQLQQCLDCVNKGDTGGAMAIILSVVKSGGVVMKGLVTRRDDDVRLYGIGKY